ncbi:MAG TPA: UbiA family prenyltransferase [Candidatus Dormibacteraeota bacterium]|nr:UbiA family prenyltransferase [Candidatus Dormibacteraeota bacterium]
MTKRKRAPRPPADESTDDASVKDDMVHVSPDLLAGSPDIFAARKTEDADNAPAMATEPAGDQPAEEPVGIVEPTAASTTPSPEPPTAAEPPAPPPPPQFVQAVPYPARRGGGGSTAALGIVLVVVGLFALLVVLSGIDLTQNGWPLFIILPGLTLLVVGFVSFGGVATVPGGIVTMLGLVLAYANSTGDWPSWAYAWSLVIPGGIGLGIYLQALRDHDQAGLRSGRNLLFISLMIFLIGFVVFESILGISGRDYFGNVGKGALPALLIIVGIILLVRSIQAGRRA